MRPVPAAVVAGALIVAGKWSDGNEPTIDNAIGVAGIALGLALLEQANPQLASGFAVLIVLSVAFIYLPVLAKNTGLARK